MKQIPLLLIAAAIGCSGAPARSIVGPPPPPPPIDPSLLIADSGSVPLFVTMEWSNGVLDTLTVPPLSQRCLDYGVVADSMHVLLDFTLPATSGGGSFHVETQPWFRVDSTGNQSGWISSGQLTQASPGLLLIFRTPGSGWQESGPAPTALCAP